MMTQQLLIKMHALAAQGIDTQKLYTDELV